LYDPTRLLQIMRRGDLSAVAACTRENIRYFADFDPVGLTLMPYGGCVCWVLVTREDPTVIHVVCSLGEADQILDASRPVGETVLYGTFYREMAQGVALLPDEARLAALMAETAQGKSPATAVIELLGRLGLASGRVAVDEHGAPAGLLAAVQSGLPDCQIIHGSHLLREVRRIKTKEEVVALQAAAESIEAGIKACVDIVTAGICEVEIAREFERAVLSVGARPALTMLKVGRAAVGGQRRQSASSIVKAGDVLWFDCDVVKDGYWADVARVFAFRDDRRFRRIFDALYAGQTEAMQRIRPGMTGGEVFDLTMSFVHRAGFPEYRRHHVGHGIGLEPYEAPILAPGNRDRIEAGMVLSVETPYYEFGLGALHIEDPIVVGERENTVLTKSTGNIVVI
jgi:Xaa-Pro dipeptidase